MHSYIAFYSTVSGLSRSKWGISGRGPRTLKPLETEEEDFDGEEDTTYDSPFRKKAVRDPTPHQWAAHQATLKKEFPEGWAPPRKLSRDAMDGLRSLHAANPELLTTPVLAEKFRISPEAVRRILKSKWEPSKDKRARLLEKERKSREEWIAQRREEEWQKQKELEEQYRRQKQYFGVNRDDKLSFT